MGTEKSRVVVPWSVWLQDTKLAKISHGRYDMFSALRITTHDKRRNYIPTHPDPLGFLLCFSLKWMKERVTEVTFAYHIVVRLNIIYIGS
jgi:hypothetical protein